nr:YgiQ family radical SAM protein [uncultured Caproiciproducens sp.]
MPFLPVTKEEIDALGWDAPDFIVVTGDAYVDHPTFGAAIISRVLESFDYHVAILAQPDWRSNKDFTRFGKPKYGFMVGSGNIDSMVAHYTVARRRRREDAYSPGNKTGLRPDRALNVYTKKIKEIYPDSPVIIGGLEASLRRFAHYDYWDDKIRPSVLLDSGADLLTYGMGEKQTIEIARRLYSGEPVSTITDVRGTCYAIPTKEYRPVPAVDCPSFEQVSQNKKEYAVSCRKQQDEQDAVRGRRVIQRHGDRMLIQNPPMPPLPQEEFDAVYDLPYMRTYHPCYESMGGVPAIQEVEFSITHNRGCFGACNFCSIAFHQGRSVTTRSEDSILREAKKLTENPNFKGYIHDVGGPTANFRNSSCEKQEKLGLCAGGKKCLAPKPCPSLRVDHSEYLGILRKLRALPKVKRVFIRSGIRFDYLIEDKDDAFFKELVKYHVSGQLKVAPEHCTPEVLDCMGKPHIESFLKFEKKYYKFCKEDGKEQYLVPYLMSSHPGSTMKDAVALALFLKREHLRPEQVQDFYPTPGTISTCMFYTGLDPYTMKEVYIPRTDREKAMQRALLQYFNPKNKDLVIDALKAAGRSDLIGADQSCLVRPSVAMQRATQVRNREKQGKWSSKKTTARR